MGYFRVIKRAVAMALIMTLAACAACADGYVLAMADTRGLKASSAKSGGGDLSCDYSLTNSNNATMSWTEAGKVYTVKGDPAAVSQLYVDALALGGWQVCRYTIGKRVYISYGVKSKKKYDTLDDYLVAMQNELGVTVTTNVTNTPKPVAEEHDYVLNTNSHKFHKPSCSDAEKIKNKNRQNITCSREELIERGYKPCKKCNP